MCYESGPDRSRARIYIMPQMHLYGLPELKRPHHKAVDGSIDGTNVRRPRRDGVTLKSITIDLGRGF